MKVKIRLVLAFCDVSWGTSEHRWREKCRIIYSNKQKQKQTNKNTQEGFSWQEPLASLKRSARAQVARAPARAPPGARAQKQNIVAN